MNSKKVKTPIILANLNIDNNAMRQRLAETRPDIAAYLDPNYGDGSAMDGGLNGNNDSIDFLSECSERQFGHEQHHRGRSRIDYEDDDDDEFPSNKRCRQWLKWVEWASVSEWSASANEWTASVREWVEWTSGSEWSLSTNEWTARVSEGNVNVCEYVWIQEGAAIEVEVGCRSVSVCEAIDWLIRVFQ